MKYVKQDISFGDAAVYTVFTLVLIQMNSGESKLFSCFGFSTII